MLIHAQACMHAGDVLIPFEYDPGEIKPTDIEISISHCGICHSDLHLMENDWGTNSYPLVPGHEIVGVVTATGAEVAGINKGMRVGVGWQRGSCGDCSHCVAGEENVCTRTEATCIGSFGGFAEAIRCHHRFVFPIPDVISSELAAPLLCAGVTVFSPLARAGIASGMKVGVLGIGGLGHLALQFAKAMGADVTAISSSKDKEEEARKLGADHFINSSNGMQMKRASRSFHFLISTVSSGLEWTHFLSQVRPGGDMCLVGVPKEPLVIPIGTLIGGQKSISGSSIGGTKSMQAMLKFAAKHDVRPQVECLPMDQANLGITKLKNNSARYRIVLLNF
ncbi:MAG: NAD(P)-dependent alcohol dehydrogenase [Gammaproteobacteria bacterium]